MQTVLPTVTSTAVGRRKRAIEEVVVTVISNEKYDATQNYLHYKVADAMFEDIASTKGVRYNKNNIIQEVKNEGGKFALQYNITDADCYAVRNFVSEAKSSTSHFRYATVDCEDGKYLI
ncbi:hypothetical protein RB195_021012 [Necator americanus]